MATEIEIKLAFKKGFSEPQINNLEVVLKSLGCDYVISKKTLENTYFNTPDFLLNKHKVALRIREKTNEQGKNVFVQTFKTAGHSVNGLSQRGEWEWVLPENSLNLDELQQCDAWPKVIGLDSLVAVFETSFTRYLANINWGDSTVELVLDWGHIISGGKQEKIHEIELELKSGNQDDLKSLSDQLKKYLPLLASDTSKAERGFKLFKLPE